MELKELQKKIREHGDRFKSKGEQIQSRMPNHAAFPVSKQLKNWARLQTY